MSSVSLKSDVIMWPKREKLSTCSLILLLLLLLAYAKKDFFVIFNRYSQFGFKLFLSFFIKTLACHLPWTMPVALIMAANGVYHPTSAALIIGRQRRQGTGVLREGNQMCVNVYDVIEMCAPAAPPIMLRIRTRSLNPNPKP